MNAADLAVGRLKQFGIERVFTLCGNGLDPLLAACDRAGLDLVDVHNEQAAAYMADAHARLTGRLGVCAVSSGVAHANALTGVVNAHFDGAPLLLITGSSDQATFGLGHFQELDQVAMAAPVCKLARRIDRPERVGPAIDEAFAVATAARPGPVHLTIPQDVLAAEIDQRCRHEPCGPPPAGRAGPGDPDLIDQAAALLDRAERPVIVAGSGVFYAHAEEALADFAAAAAVPVVIPIWDRGCVGRPSRQFAGFVGAASGQPELLGEADLIILVAGRVDYRVGFLRPPNVRSDARLIRISGDGSELSQGRQADVAVLGDPAAVLTQFAERPAEPKNAWLDEVQERVRQFRAHWRQVPERTDAGLTGRGLVELLRPFLSDELIFLIDGGDIGQWAHMLLGDRYPAHWLTCGASGVVGWGLPGAIAAKLAHPHRPVLLLSGDGAAGFTIAELEVAVRFRVPIVMLIADDQGWGIVVAGQRRKLGKTIASRLGPTRYDLVAQGFGARGIRTADPEELGGILVEALSARVPTVIQVPIELGSPTDHARSG